MRDYKVNEEMTGAVIENYKDILKVAKKIEDCDGDILSAVFGCREENRFYGTKINENVVKRLRLANRKLDVIGATGEIEIQKFNEPNPRCREAVVAITVHDMIADFKGELYSALDWLIGIADSVSIMPRDNRTVRIVFVFNNLWEESRLMSDEEIEEEKNKFLEDTNHD